MGENIGRRWLSEVVDNMVDHVDHVSPVQFNEENRYLPQGVSPRPGPVRYDLFPFLIEIVNCFDPLSPAREVNVMKGAQIGFTTGVLEAVLLYYIAHIKTQPGMFLTADKEMATARMENSILTMLHASGFADAIQTSDTGNRRKTGKTKDYLQWRGGGSLIYNGAQNAAKMRMWSVIFMLKDELDGWKRSIGKDGNSDKLTDARLKAYWESRKILRGSTPLTEPSMIHEAFLRGDQRYYRVLCKACSFPQVLKFREPNAETGIVAGFKYDIENGKLLTDSVRYGCADCGHDHFEHDKEKLFALEEGAHWHPTATPREQGIWSYHISGFYSPFGITPWSKCIADFLTAYDPVKKQVRDITVYQEYHNNTLGMPFQHFTSSISRRAVSGHRRHNYRLGEIPNTFAAEHSGSKILFLTCQVDVHKRNLAVTVFGWCVELKPYVIDYWRFDRKDEDDDCQEISSPVWQRLRDLIDEKEYTADDGTKYRLAITAIDAGYAQSTVTTFCSEYNSGVYPIIGVPRTAGNRKGKEFSEFEAQDGTPGFTLLVDHYKDRMAPVMRRDWAPDMGPQAKYHFNVPTDITDKQLRELTRETRIEETDTRGRMFYYWKRSSTSAPNELWDLAGYGYAIVEIMAWLLLKKDSDIENINWEEFWSLAEDVANESEFCRLAPPEDVV